MKRLVLISTLLATLTMAACDKPTVVKIHGYCVAGGTDIALHADQVIAAADAKIGYPPTRVWGVPAAGLLAVAIFGVWGSIA